MKEVWKSIDGYEGIYEISNLGRVKSLPRKYVLREKIIIPYISTSGYFVIKLCGNNKFKAFTIHRLIAQAFIPNPNNKPCINHIDSDRKNNNLDNLEWCTHKENNAHAVKQGRNYRGEKQHLSKLKESQVLEIRESIGSHAEIGRKYNVSYTTIERIRNRKIWKWL